MESSSVVDFEGKARPLFAPLRFLMLNDMHSRDKNIINKLYDIIDLTCHDLIGAANIPAVVKFFVLRFPIPFFEGRALRDLALAMACNSYRKVYYYVYGVIKH